MSLVKCQRIMMDLRKMKMKMIYLNLRERRNILREAVDYTFILV